MKCVSSSVLILVLCIGPITSQTKTTWVPWTTPFSFTTLAPSTPGWPSSANPSTASQTSAKPPTTPGWPSSIKPSTAVQTSTNGQPTTKEPITTGDEIVSSTMEPSTNYPSTTYEKGTPSTKVATIIPPITVVNTRASQGSSFATIIREGFTTPVNGQPSTVVPTRASRGSSFATI
ncbi:unnamed protein product, partial [Owenia fusiformis]